MYTPPFGVWKLVAVADDFAEPDKMKLVKLQNTGGDLQLEAAANSSLNELEQRENI